KGNGVFSLDFTIGAGNRPTGISVRDLNSDNDPDLVIGNEFGDPLVLRGSTGVTFETYRPDTQRISLAIATLDNPQQNNFAFGDQALDQVLAAVSGPSKTPVPAGGIVNASGTNLNQQGGVLAPGPIYFQDVNGDSIKDLVLCNTGANKVVVCLGKAGGGWG